MTLSPTAAVDVRAALVAPLLAVLQDAGAPGTSVDVVPTDAGPLVRIGLAGTPPAALRGAVDACVRRTLAPLLPLTGVRVVYEVGAGW